MNVNFNSERFLYREIKTSDLDDMYELDSDPDVHIYLGNNPVTSKSQSEDIIADIKQQYIENGIGRSAIISKVSGAFIGWSGLKLEKKLREEFSYYDLGYRLKKEHWGHGYATEAALASLSHGFLTLNLEKICAAADIRNLASNHILSKIGMIKKEPFVYQSVTCNWFELTAKEWLKAQNQSD